MYNLNTKTEDIDRLEQFRTSPLFLPNLLIIRDILGASSVEGWGRQTIFKFKRLKDARYAQIMLLEFLCVTNTNKKYPQTSIDKDNGVMIQ